MATLEDFIAALAQAIEQLARGALQRARDFSWEEKARVVDRIYRAKVAIGKGADAGTQ